MQASVTKLFHIVSELSGTLSGVQELKKSVKTLTSILRNIESVTGDVAGLSVDSGAHATLRQLIDAFSRLVAD